MNATVIDKKRRMTLPEHICAAIGLKPNDQVEWRVENGEIRGRKLVDQESREMFLPGSLLKYFTPEKEEKERRILSGCIQGPREAQ